MGISEGLQENSRVRILRQKEATAADYFHRGEWEGEMANYHPDRNVRACARADHAREIVTACLQDAKERCGTFTNSMPVVQLIQVLLLHDVVELIASQMRFPVALRFLNSGHAES